MSTLEELVHNKYGLGHDEIFTGAKTPLHRLMEELMPDVFADQALRSTTFGTILGPNRNFYDLTGKNDIFHFASYPLTEDDMVPALGIKMHEIDGKLHLVVQNDMEAPTFVIGWIWGERGQPSQQLFIGYGYSEGLEITPGKLTLIMLPGARKSEDDLVLDLKDPNLETQFKAMAGRWNWRVIDSLCLSGDKLIVTISWPQRKHQTLTIPLQIEYPHSPE